MLMHGLSVNGLSVNVLSVNVCMYVYMSIYV